MVGLVLMVQCVRRATKDEPTLQALQRADRWAPSLSLTSHTSCLFTSLMTLGLARSAHDNHGCCGKDACCRAPIPTWQRGWGKHYLFIIQSLTKRRFPLVLSPGTVLFFIRGMEDWMVRLSPPAHCCGEESSCLGPLPLQCYAK